jgi:hypothetical protein
VDAQRGAAPVSPPPRREPQSAPARSEPAQAERSAPITNPSRARSSRRSLAFAVIGGLLAAAAIVGAAVHLRPMLMPAAPAPPSDAAPAEPADGAETVAEAGGTWLRLGPDVPVEREAEIVSALDAAGYGPVEVRRTGFRITASRIGFYRQEDRDAAEVLSRRILPILGDDQDGITVRDYGKLLPDAAPGRLDLWIAG